MSATNSENFAPLTTENLKAFTSTCRRQRDRSRGRSTRSTSPDLHDYIDDKPVTTTTDLIRPKIKKKTASEIAAHEALWREVCVQNGWEVPKSTDLEEAHRAEIKLDMITTLPEDDGVLEPHISDPGCDETQNAQDYEYKPWRPSLPRTRPWMPRQWDPELREEQNTQNLVDEASGLPTYHCTHNINQTAAYLANASYVAALAGPPISDTKYGIIIVPAGEERTYLRNLLELVDSDRFFKTVHNTRRNYEAGARMYNMDRDSAEFARHRFDEAFPDLEPEQFSNVAVTLPTAEGTEEPKKMSQGSAVGNDQGDGEQDGKESRDADNKHKTLDLTTNSQENHLATPTPQDQKTTSKLLAPNDNLSSINTRQDVDLIRRATRATRKATVSKDYASKPHGIMKTRRSPRSSVSKARSPASPSRRVGLRGDRLAD